MDDIVSITLTHKESGKRNNYYLNFACTQTTCVRTVDVTTQLRELGLQPAIIFIID